MFDLVVDGGTLAPGKRIGTTSVHGDVMFNDGSTLEIALDGNSSDLLVVVGRLDLGTETQLDIVQLSDDVLDSRYLIATYQGDLDGSFQTITNGFSIDASTPGELYLLVPEPTTGVFLLATVWALFACAQVRRKS